MKSYLHNTFNFVQKSGTIGAASLLTLSSSQLLADTRIFIDPATKTGNYTDRATADALCENSSANPAIAGNTVKAFLSLSDTDGIRDFPTNHNLNTNERISRADGGLQIASDWDALLDSTNNALDHSFEASGKSIWTFSEADGSLRNNLNCENGTDGTDEEPGGYGSSGSTSKTSLVKGIAACNIGTSTAYITFSKLSTVSAPISITGW